MHKKVTRIVLLIFSSILIIGKITKFVKVTQRSWKSHAPKYTFSMVREEKSIVFFVFTKKAISSSQENRAVSFKV